MKILIALLACGAACLASTHIVDTVYMADGITPIAFGHINVQGYQRNANGKTALTSTITVPIVAGAVDFSVEGGTNVYFQATVYLTTSDGKTVLSSYKEPVWVVADTTSTLKITDIRGAAIPANLYVASGTYCLTVTPPTWTIVSCASAGTVSWGGLTSLQWASLTSTQWAGITP